MIKKMLQGSMREMIEQGSFVGLRRRPRLVEVADGGVIKEYVRPRMPNADGVEAS